MRTLAIDIETYSSNDLLKTGVYKYSSAEDFEILLFAYSFDDAPISIADFASGEKLPKVVLDALTDPDTLKTAFNANFERTCLQRHFGIHLPVEQWECTAVKGSMLGFPSTLEMTAKVLKLGQEKSPEGKGLIRYFSLPCKPTKTNGERTRNLPEHDRDRWEKFKNYCVQDVVVEKSIRKKIEFFTIPETEKQLWFLDQKINDRGVLLDPGFVNNAIGMDVVSREKLTKEAIELTGLDNPNSAAQLKRWLTEEIDTEVTKLTKEAIPVLLKSTESDVVTRVLNIRQEMAKTSVKKYVAMKNCICPDLRVRGLLQFYGANRTGRWAGRLVQVQNLPKNNLKDLDLARKIVRSGDTDYLEMLFGNVPDTLSQLIRTSFVAPKGGRFIVSDFSAIEARVIAWLANEKWRIDVFNTHGEIYEASAAQMFKVPIESISYKNKQGEKVKGPNYELRAKGKIAELALGYQGGPNALEKMGALKMGIPKDDLPKLVSMWRNANKKIVQFWETLGDAAMEAVTEGRPITIQYGIRFFVEKNTLFIELPSKRRLAYLNPSVRPGQYGDVLAYEGMDQTTKRWTVQETYGGKIAENIVQAVARDCLADAMLRLDKLGYEIVMHVHDEVVIEAKADAGSLKEVTSLMSKPISWAPGLPLNAEGFETPYYKKD